MQTFYSIYYLINCALRRAHFKIWSKMVDALRLHMRIKQAEKYAGGRENGLIVAYRPNSCPASDFFSSGHEWTDYCIWAESISRVELPLCRTRVAPTTSRRSQPTLSMAYKSKSTWNFVTPLFIISFSFLNILLEDCMTCFMSSTYFCSLLPCVDSEQNPSR